MTLQLKKLIYEQIEITQPLNRTEEQNRQKNIQAVLNKQLFFLLLNGYKLLSPARMVMRIMGRMDGGELTREREAYDAVIIRHHNGMSKYPEPVRGSTGGLLRGDTSLVVI